MLFAASDAEIKEFWSAVLRVDSTIVHQSQCLQPSISTDHCCQHRHYSFDILKCGLPTCTIYKPPHLPKKDFEKFPDPVIGDDDHYLPFSKVFGTQTTDHLPRNQRMLYSCTKLSADERGKIQDKLTDVSFTCGSPIEDLGDDLPVYTRSLNCYEPVEKLY